MLKSLFLDVLSAIAVVVGELLQLRVVLLDLFCAYLTIFNIYIGYVVDELVELYGRAACPDCLLTEELY